jgi:hypothetical protein
MRLSATIPVAVAVAMQVACVLIIVFALPVLVQQVHAAESPHVPPGAQPSWQLSGALRAEQLRCWTVPGTPVSCCCGCASANAAAQLTAAGACSTFQGPRLLTEGALSASQLQPLSEATAYKPTALYSHLVT